MVLGLAESEPFNERQGLSQYTEGWLKEKLAQSDSSDTVRMTFVLSDGGASRSGLWATSVFTYLTSETNGKFRDNLFCLAGASGGGVGNSVYFSWLDTQLKNERAELGWMNNQMRFDFLAPTVGRLLSTDYFRHVFPLNRLPMSDRAGILEESMENTGTGLMDKPMSSLVTCKKKIGYKLPLLYINTTRMQDAMPAVVSNINLKEHSERLDVLTLLDSMPMNEMHDINLSTAAVLGSRFPYVSPAGAIKNHYFVDGGYFDNSGAGIAHETMLFIDQNKEKLRLEKRIIEFLVIHIQNNSLGSDSLKSVHPLVNDLAAPGKTLAGSYSQQTNLNDGRLYQYLYNRQGGNSGLTYEEWLPSAASAVYKINLYDAEVCNNSKLPMSWAISATKADTMSIQCLQGNTRLRSLVKKLKD